LSETSVPPDVAQFIRQCIDRLETLDVLLLLQATSSKDWTVQQISDEMRSSLLAAETAIATLLTHGLVSREGSGYRFRPATPGLEEQTQRLAACYRERRAAVITQIVSRRTDSIRSFADAFRIKKDD
jgi:DNA-binding IclR family transcriptional regulator